MAKNRLVNTRFWTDTYVLDELNPVDKLLFLYLITNPYTDISGVYELPLKVMAVETGIDRDNIVKVILPRLQRDGKIYYKDGWVAIKNFQKHQTLNPKVQKGMEEGMKKAPPELRAFMLSDSLSIEDDSLSHSNTNSNTNTNTNEQPSETEGVAVNRVIELFKEINPSYSILFRRKSQREAASRLLSRYGLERLSAILGYIRAHSGAQYFPTITTPCQLEEKWASLETFAKKQKKQFTNFVM